VKYCSEYYILPYGNRTIFVSSGYLISEHAGINGYGVIDYPGYNMLLIWQGVGWAALSISLTSKDVSTEGCSSIRYIRCSFVSFEVSRPRSSSVLASAMQRGSLPPFSLPKMSTTPTFSS